MENEQPKKRKRRSKTDYSEYDTYVANVSNGMNPPSARKRRKKKPDEDAYDAYLAEDKPVTRRARREERGEEAEMPERKRKTSAGKRKEEAETPERRRKTSAGKRRSRRSSDDYDAYLEKLEASDAELPKELGELPVQPKKRRKRRRKHKKGFSKKILDIAYIAAMLAVLTVFGVFGTRQAQQYRDYRAMRTVVDNQSFYPGTSVDGFDLAGMTLAQAEDFFVSSVEPMYSARSVIVSTGEMLLAEQLGYTSNFKQVLRAAWANGRSGTLEDRYRAIQSGVHSGTQYVVSRTFYTEDAVRSAVSDVAKRINQEGTPPHVTGFDAEKLEFTFQPGDSGSVLNEERLTDDICYVMANGGGKVEAVVDAVDPPVSVDDIRGNYGRISFTSTNASSSSAGRLTNLRLACEAIDGYCLKPGAEFSYNETLGRRTAEKGYQVAGVYASGTTATGVGGGICQVASTLFNSAVKANLDITKRSPHSLPVHYLPLGQDAAINWPNKDLRFKNNGTSPVYISAKLTSGKDVEIGIYGEHLPNGETIEIKGVKTATISYDTIYKVDKRLGAGKTRTKEGHRGYKAITYKIRLDANGNEISKETLCYSTYPKGDAVVYTGG